MSAVIDTEFCAWCLGWRDATCRFRCRGCGALVGAGNPIEIRRFAEAHAWGEGHPVDLDAFDNALIAVSIWRGTPVCSAHLQDAVDDAFRSGRMYG